MKGHLISLAIFIPLLGAIGQVIGPANKKDAQTGWARISALSASFISSVFSIALVFMMDPQVSDVQISERLSWIGSFAISYDVGIDGGTAPLILLVALVFPVLVLAEWSVTEGARGIYGLFLLLQSSMLGMLFAQDLFLLLFFLAMSTLPFYFLFSLWGDSDRETAAFRYVVSASLGNALIFSALLLIYYAAEPHTFSMKELMGGKLAGKTIGLFGTAVPVAPFSVLLLSVGLAFRIPVWPLQGWYSYVCRQATPSVLVALIGVFLPCALSLFSKITFSLFPEEVVSFSRVLLIIGVVNLIFGAVTVVAHRELRSLMGSLGVILVGYFLVGMSSLEATGLIGGTYQLLAMGLALSGFGLLVQLIRDRAGRSEVIDESGAPLLGGLVTEAPMMALVTGVFIASFLGFPGFGGFVGHSLIVMGGFSVHSWIVWVVGAALLLMVYGLFSMFRTMFLGKAVEGRPVIADLSIREKLFLFPLLSGTVLLGFYPKPVLDLMRPSLVTLLSIVK